MKNILFRDMQIVSKESFRSSHIKSTIVSIAGNSIQFFLHRGKPEIVYSSEMSIYLLIPELMEFRYGLELQDNLLISSSNYTTVNVVLLNATQIFRKTVNQIPSSGKL